MKTGQSVGFFGQLFLLETPVWWSLCIRCRFWQPFSEETGDVELGMSAVILILYHIGPTCLYHPHCPYQTSRSLWLSFFLWLCLVFAFFITSLISKVEKYKWFSVFFLIMSFFVIPAAIYGLSLINTVLLYLVLCTLLLLAILGLLITFVQRHKPNW